MMNQIACALLMLGGLYPPLWAADWPMYRCDAARSGFTPEELPAKLSLRWIYRSRHAPAPAWPRAQRMPFDRAYQPVVAGGLVFFGSSTDGKVYALDAATGRMRWSYFTDGPVRFAPAVWTDRLFVASDDGHLYCLAAKTGKLLWKKRGGPDDRMLLGNGRMISRWPARGGPVVVGDKVYFGAGMWPSEGIYLYALSAAKGRVLWSNTTSGAMVMDQPHGGARVKSGPSVQGYLVAAADLLLVPTGRAVPAAFGRADGKFRYFHLQRYGQVGGSPIVAAGDVFFNRGEAYEVKTGNQAARRAGDPVVALPRMILRYGRGRLSACTWVSASKTDRRGKPVASRALKEAWSVSGVAGGAALIAAARTAVSGGDKKVTAVDLASKKVAWSAPVDGKAYGLAASGGRLYVSTDAGTIYCFGAGAPSRVVTGAPPARAAYGGSAAYAAAAKEIVQKTGVTEGYCLDLACGDGSLAHALAKRTKLRIYAIDADAKNVAKARKKLEAAGLYGVRVTVHQASPTKTPYPDYFADLVVSGRSVTIGSRAVPRLQEVRRMLRPFGGVSCIGKPRAMRKSVRGALKGAGSWTHQYANAANTGCSTDTLVKGQLGMLWFGDWDLPMPQRHGRGPAPLFSEGRLFVEGLHALRAVDAYNGRLLWEYALKDVLVPYNQDHLMGTAGTGSNFCVAAGSVYVSTGDRCLRLDAATGKKLAEFTVSKATGGKSGTWGYVACADGTLFGSVVNEAHIVKWTYRKSRMEKLFTESSALFALDAVTGRPKWVYRAKHSIRHNAIAIGGRRVYLIDRPAAEGDRISPRGSTKGGPPRASGVLLALDAGTGRVKWRVGKDVYGTVLALSRKHNVLLMSYQPTRFRLPSERGGRMTALRATTSQRLWEIKARYASRPLINDRTVYAQPGAWDLLTGRQTPFRFGRSYGCGTLAGSRNMLVFRSATLGYRDLRSNRGTENYGGIRPGCWINAIPAGGLVLMPDASAGCRCSYLLQAAIALQPRK